MSATGVTTRYALCIYCGRRLRQGIACAYHRDLLKLDPHYTEARR
jgi:hypothetical protein